MKNRQIFFIIIAIFAYSFYFQNRYEFVVLKKCLSDGTILSEWIYCCDKTTGACKPAYTR